MMFIETLEFTIPVDLCSLCTTLQKSTQSGLEFPASVNSYGTTQDASIQVALKANKLTFKVDGVSSNASIISKSECRTLKLSVFDVDRTLIPQESDSFPSNNVSNYHSTPVSNSQKRTYEQSPTATPVRAKIRRNSGGENKKNKSLHVDRMKDSHSNNRSKSMDDSSSNNVLIKTEPEDPDLIEIDPDPEPLKTEQPDQASSCMYEQSSLPSYEQNVPHVQDYSEPSTSQQHRTQRQNVDDFLVFQDDSYENDDNEEYSNDDMGQLGKLGNSMTLTSDLMPFPFQQPRFRLPPRKNFPCPLCEKAFSDPCALNYHREAIHEKKTFQCICGKVYKYRPGLLGHRKNCPIYQSQGQGHDPGSGTGYSSSYNREQNLPMQVMPEPDNDSMMVLAQRFSAPNYPEYGHAQAQISSSDPDNFETFLNSISPLRGSTDKRLWQCEHCGKTFTNSNNKRFHVQAVHGNKTYNCVCGKQYKYPCNLIRHKNDCAMAKQSDSGQQ